MERGKGLMIALEFHSSLENCRFISEDLMKNGVLVKETHGTIVRLSPPLTITKEDVDWAINHIDATLQKLKLLGQ
jgi:ornithine--oxo-acid transaminase